MRKSTFLLTLICGTILFSCNSNSKEKSADNSDAMENSQDEASKLAQYEDSIKKADVLAIELFRKDSIDALQIKAYDVKKISGKHKYGGFTKIEYQSLQQLIIETKKKSEKEMWTKEQFKSNIEALKAVSVGGQVRLDIERITIDCANTENFTIIIKDSAENELFRKALDSNIPNPSSLNDNWWNITLCTIDKRIKVPFYVYVVDALEDAPFKFEVTAIKK